MAEFNRQYELKINEAYISAMTEYNQRHYGIHHASLIDPQMIVAHATHCATLMETLFFFTNEVKDVRKDIAPGGRAKTGAHFIVDRDGAVYTYVPLDYTARHIIGFNYTSVGIENVAANNRALTKKQLHSNIYLIQRLKEHYASIRYIIGHHEYTDRHRPHYKLLKARDRTYLPQPRTDPGSAFMRQLRQGLEP